jgi:hypothetical protein
MPAGGGSLDIIVMTTANTIGSLVAPHRPVTLTASSGSLSASTFNTDETGHAKVTWTGASSATITAIADDLTTTAAITVPGSTPAPTPSPTPQPSPAPSPSPTPTPDPTPTPPPPPLPQPKPAGDLVATITASPSNPDANQSVSLSVALTSTTGAAVPAIESWIWDVNGDRLPDHREAAPTVSYPAGPVSVFLEVLTADGRYVDATLPLTVGPAPAVRVALDATPTAVQLGDTVTLTATVTPTGNVGTLSYGWDVDGNGTVEQTTSTPSIDHDLRDDRLEDGESDRDRQPRRVRDARAPR